MVANAPVKPTTELQAGHCPWCCMHSRIPLTESPSPFPTVQRDPSCTTKSKLLKVTSLLIVRDRQRIVTDVKGQERLVLALQSRQYIAI